MKTFGLVHVGALIALLLSVTGCRQDKAVGPAPVFPDNGTRLYFADCEPWLEDQESTDLVPDPADACNQNITFYPEEASTPPSIWRSNVFRPSAGTVTEGYHLVFTRSSESASQLTVFTVVLTGLATQFTRRIEFPLGETTTIIEVTQTGTVSLPEDSIGTVALQIQDSVGVATLSSSSVAGSFVYTGVESSYLCQFEVDLGLSHGIGQPNGALNIGFLHTSGPVQCTMAWDFTGGASLSGTLFVFGPRYGVAYAVGLSGGCVDTAAFWAPPPSQALRDDTLGTFALTDYWNRHFLSDGNTLWVWDDVPLPPDSAVPRRVRVAYRTEWPIIQHPVWDRFGQVNVAYDQTRDRIWIVESSSSSSDTAWGYMTTGQLDTVVVSDAIPSGVLYRGQWVQVTDTNAFVTEVDLIPFEGGAGVRLGEYPTGIVRSFAGGAGYGLPGVAEYASWSVNTFDVQGFWVGRYPVTVGANEHVNNIEVLTAEEMVVYVARVVAATSRYEVHVLRPS
jgi:hypothetical protein